MRPLTLPQRAVAGFMRGFYYVALHPALPVAAQRAFLEASAPIQPLPDGAVFRRERPGGVDTERVTVGATERATAVLYLHGGAYTIGSAATHRPLTATLARETGSVVYAPNYRLAPEHPYPAALDDAEAVWDSLRRDHGFAASDIAVAGDSAGGGLAAALTRRLVDKGEAPAALALISPWVDPGDHDAPFPRDLVVNTGWSTASSAAYLGGGDPRDPGFAPLHGSVDGFPPTVVHVGITEVLHGQVLRFVTKLREGGVEVDLVEYDTLWHVAHLQATMMREAADAVAELAAFVNDRFDAGSDTRVLQDEAPALPR